MVFALAAEEAKLEVVALLSRWRPHPTHPSIVTREHWIANQLYRWILSVDVVHVHPGIFAFIYLLVLPAIVHMGMFVAPFGDGKNAPPSNEGIARVAVGVLTNPCPHIGKSYRPTGPELLPPHDIAGILTNVTGHKVKYQDSSIKMFAKAAKALGACFASIKASQTHPLSFDFRWSWHRLLPCRYLWSRTFSHWPNAWRPREGAKDDAT